MCGVGVPELVFSGYHLRTLWSLFDHLSRHGHLALLARLLSEKPWCHLAQLSLCRLAQVATQLRAVLHGVLPVPTPFSSTSTEEGEGVSPSEGPTEQVLKRVRQYTVQRVAGSYSRVGVNSRQRGRGPCAHAAACKHGK